MWDLTAGTCTTLESAAFIQDQLIIPGCSQVKLSSFKETLFGGVFFSIFALENSTQIGWMDRYGTYADQPQH